MNWGGNTVVIASWGDENVELGRGDDCATLWTYYDVYLQVFKSEFHIMSILSQFQKYFEGLSLGKSDEMYSWVERKLSMKRHSKSIGLTKK